MLLRESNCDNSRPVNILALVLVAGCFELPATPTTDTAAPTARPMACDRREVYSGCEEYLGPGWDDDAARELPACLAPDVVLFEPCPPTDLGGCDQRPDGAMVWYYTGDRYDADDRAGLERSCEDQGWRWVDP